jgi:microcystin degradation protein MlrC
MHRILLAECEQEISSFNPVLSQYEDFEVHRGADLIAANEAAETCIRGALQVFRGRPDVQVIPTYGAKACSAGPLSRPGFERLASELLSAIRERMQETPGVDALYFSLHGAMGAEHELDPEGYLLEEVRKLLGPDRPIVCSLDLHGILTARMLRQLTGLAVYHTYPHADFVDTGERAARLLLRILGGGVRPVMARVIVPALVRGPELMTKTGVYGEIIRTAQELERKESVLAAAMIIGNPFTDVPELCSQAVVVTDNAPTLAEKSALRLAKDFWAQRERMQARLTPLAEAIAEAKTLTGPVTFTDAADAPSSGASGDSSAILAGLIEHGYPGTVLLPIVDAAAVRQAMAAGVGQRIPVALGGSLDPRFTPVRLDVTVEMLSRGRFTFEFSGTPADAGPTAVLLSKNLTIIAMSRPVLLMDRSLFLAHGQDPRRFDLIVVKSPGAYARYFTWAARNFVVDVPGATSANLLSLPYRHCRRPMFPLDPDATFTPQVELFGP